MNVLLIGSGGREHALAWKIAQSSQLRQLFCCPGNPGTQKIAINIDINFTNHAAIVEFCQQSAINFVVIGPELPLVAGLSDFLRQHNITVFGPSQAASQLEASKAFTKAICEEYHIPTASYVYVTNLEDALVAVEHHALPLVVKADGLAAGKGVFICATRDEAKDAIATCFGGSFGQAGASVVIEDFLEGEEASFFALCDGYNAIPFATAQDYKRAFDGDKGPNTGGMGAVSPAPMMTLELEHTVMTQIVKPTLTAMINRGTPFKGILYAGLMITQQGPKLIEYNVRLGDPECQVLMMRLKSDLLPILYECAQTHIQSPIEWSNQAAMTVVLSAKGYPGHYDKGTLIHGLEAVQHMANVEIFHAGTSTGKNGEVIATGGRVLSVSAVAGTIEDAQKSAYHAIHSIDWPEGFYRSDIGWRSIDRDQRPS